MFVSVWHIENLYFLLDNISPNMSYGAHRTIAHKVRVLHLTGFKVRSVRSSEGISSFIPRHRYSKFDFLREPRPQDNIHSLLHTTLKDWSTMIGQYTYYSISYPSFHTYTYINKFCDERILFFTLEKYRTLMIGPLWLCFSWDIFTSNFDKTRNMLLYIDTSGEQD